MMVVTYLFLERENGKVLKLNKYNSSSKCDTPVTIIRGNTVLV